MKIRRILIGLLFLALIPAVTVQADLSQGSLDTGFDPSIGVNGSLAAVALQPARVADVTVTTTTDVLDAAGSCDAVTIASLPGPDGVTSLREAMCAANNLPGPDTITFEAATDGTPIVLGGAAGEDANASGDLDILDGGDLTIQGNGAANTIIDGGGIDRVFHVCPAGGCANTVTFNSVTISNGRADFGGGILNLGATLNVQDSTIGGAGAGNSASDEGGGIDNQDGTTTLDGTTISANVATYGGGICNHATLKVQNGSTIGGAGASNKADNGGGIHNFSGTTTVEASTVISNTASDDGGGIYNYAGSTMVEASTVISNTATDDGGGIYIQDGTATVEASTVSANIAGDDGGGIYNHATLNVQNSAIGGAGASNRANYGGGIHNFAGQTTVDSSTISGNTATNGAGIYNHFAATLNVRNGSTIGGAGAGNRATSNGGGIYNGSGGTTTVDASTVISNTAVHGGGIINDPRPPVQNGSTAAGNTPTGAGSILASAILKVQNGSAIGGAGAGNRATIAGGGIYNGTDGTTTVEGSTVISNTAPNGGGIHNFAGQTTVEGSTVISNTAASYGGGINNNFGTTTVDECTVISNTAPNGGGIFNYLGTTTVEGSTIISNTATANGGGIHNFSGTTTVDECTVSANTAKNGGGIYNEDTLNVTNSTIGGAGAGNTASFSGGGIYNEFGTTTVDGSTVSANTAVYGGGIHNDCILCNTTTVDDSTASAGGIYNNADSYVQNGSTIGGNTASTGGGILAQAILYVQNSTIGGVGVGNTANYGSGIYIGHDSTMQVVGSRILHNTADINGGGVFINYTDATSVTGSCIVGNSDTSFFNNELTEQTATGNWWGAVGGPDAPGADTVGGLVDTSGFLNIPILGCAPDLQVDKANNTGGNGTVGTPFNWTLTVANTGVMDAIFYAGQRILDDDLPAGPTYGAPVAGNFVDVTSGANIDCSITSNTLTCEATGANVTIGAATGSFDVVLSVTPNASGVLTNPAGNCRVDPAGKVTESDEGNNNCPANSVDVSIWTFYLYLPLVVR